jgi:hypothetical protein
LDNFCLVIREFFLLREKNNEKISQRLKTTALFKRTRKVKERNVDWGLWMDPLTSWEGIGFGRVQWKVH